MIKNKHNPEINSERADKRYKVFFTLFSFWVISIIFYYAYLMLFSDSIIKSPDLQFPEVERGSIFDRNGEILAVQTELYSVSAWLPSVSEPAETANILSEILQLEKNELLESLVSEEGSRFLYIKRKISTTEANEIQARKDKGELTGVNLIPEFGRNYPGRELASHLLGYTGLDNTGLAGIEYAYNQVLSPSRISDKKDIVRGNHVVLTIDNRVQYVNQKITREVMEKNNADSALMILMDARTGEIISYAAYPDFDPNNYNNYSSQDWMNLPVSGSYEPGSVFKVFSMASVLDLGGAGLEDTFFCDGAYHHELKNGEMINIKCLGNHGDLNIEGILVNSCNAGAAYASETVDNYDYYYKLKSFGFGQKTGITLPGETNGILRSPDRWSLRSKQTISFGQEIAVSAIQIVTAATALTNKGILLKPRIVKRIISPEGEIMQSFPREAVREVIKPETAETVLNMMNSVTLKGGGAWRIRVPGLNISAKTGTAQVLDTETGTYSEDVFISSCLAIFPTENPRYIAYLAIKAPRGNSYFGGTIATPEVKRFIQEITPVLGISYGHTEEIHHPGEMEISLPLPLDPSSATVPDFSGRSKRDIIRYRIDSGKNIMIRGKGWVQNQNPEPGTEFTESTNIELNLE